MKKVILTLLLKIKRVLLNMLSCKLSCQPKNRQQMQRNKSAIYWVYTLWSTIAFPIRCFVTSQIIVMPSNDECITLFSSCFTVLCSYIFGHSCKVNSINLAHSVHRPLLVEEYLRNTISSGSSYFTDPFILINIQFAHTRITN